MAWTSVGFDGTITEIQWAGLAGLLGNGYVAAGNGDCLVTAVSGARSVSVAAGSLYGDGVLSTNSGAETVAMTTPVNGQWYVIALRRTWATNTAALVAIAGATTTTTTPTAPPTSFPTLNTNVGVLTDQPIAWAWCNSANTTVVVYDIRLKAVKSLPPVVATSAERDAKFMSPTQGLQVWRDDLGAVETYYGLYNASTNPGGRDTAGWYTNDRQTGLMPVKPTSVTAVSGTATINAQGKISFTGCSIIRVAGAFTSKFDNYRIILTGENGTAQNNLHFKLSASGTDNSTQYYVGQQYISSNGNVGGYSAHGSTDLAFNWLNNYAPRHIGTVMELQSPAQAAFTDYQYTSVGHHPIGVIHMTGAGLHGVATAYDGFAILTETATFSGTVQILGYNS